MPSTPVTKSYIITYFPLMIMPVFIVDKVSIMQYNKSVTANEN